MILSVRSAASLALLLAAAACAHAPQRTASDAAQLAACRQTADRIYAKQNRAELYETDRFDSTVRDSPYSVSTLPDVPSRGLSGAYERDNLVDDCLNAGGPGTPPSPPKKTAVQQPPPGGGLAVPPAMSQP